MEGIIRITKMPEGEAPEWVRESWVGLCLPVCYIGNENETTEEVISLQPVEYARKCWNVDQHKAIGLLMTQNPEAARWWLNNGYPQKHKVFSFALDEAMLIMGTVPDQSAQWRM